MVFHKSRGKSILKFREYSIMLNAAESTSKRNINVWIGFSSSKDVDDLVKSNLLNDGKN